MTIDTLTHQKIKPFFDNACFQRGMSYYAEDRVDDLDIEIKNNSEIITASVEGGGERIYQVQIVLKTRFNKLTIDGECTCPVGFNCKHVVATLLSIIDENEFLTQAIDKDKRNEKSQPYKRIQQLDNWLQNLKDFLKEDTKKELQTIDESYSLRYIFSSVEKSYDKNCLYLNLKLVRQLKSGGLGACKDFNDTYSHQRHLNSIDKDLIIKLEVAQRAEKGYYYNDRIDFKNASFEKYLPELIATNRCHWLTPNTIHLTLGEAKKLEFKWQSDNKGTQELVYLISEEQAEFYHIVIIDKPWYINKKTGEMGLLNSNIEPQLLKILFAAPKIPSQIASEVVDIFDESYRFDDVTRPTLPSTDTLQTIVPDVHLKLFQASVQDYGFNENRLWTLIKKNKPFAALTFDYQGTIIQWDDTNNNSNLNSFKRHKKIENRSRDILSQLGLRPLKMLSEYNQNGKNKALHNFFLLNGVEKDYVNFSLQVIPRLREQGWKISFEPDYPYQIIEQPIDDWYSKIEDKTSSHDWFDLELGIIIDDKKINLLPVIQQELKKLQLSKNKNVDNSEPLLAQLPDGRFIPLPVERVKNLLKVLIELYDSNSLSKDNMLRLSKLQAARLLELEAATGAAQLRWYGGDKLKKLAYKITQFKEITAVNIPKEFQGHLRSYQAQGLNWLQFLREYEFGGILADDMGLGKTIQTLCHLAVEKRAGRCVKPSLIVAPTTLMFNWSNEAARFVPHLKTLMLHGAHRKDSFESIVEYDLVFTTYALLKHDKENLLKQDFYFLILDEAQSIKNFKSLTTQIAQQIKAEHRLCLTGTPMENHLGELWSLFHFLMPGLLGNEKKFNSQFRYPIEKYNNDERRQHLNRRIAPFLLRRTKTEVVKELPEKIHILQNIELEGAQRDLYETVRVTLQKKIRDEIARMGFARSQIVILDALLKLRQICCDPRLMKTAASKKIIQSSKLELLMTMLPKLIEDGRRILLFSQFTEMLSLIEAELKYQKISFVQLTGKTKDRATPVKQFQEGKVPLFLLSLKAGGTGLNLTTADTVIHYDPWWNPAVEDQATDRAHRIGQDKVVFVYKFIAKGTVEEKIQEMQQHKRGLMEGLFSDVEEGHSRFTEQDLQRLFAEN